MDRKRIQCLLKHRSMCPSIFNRFPVIQAVKSKGRHFSTFFAHFGLPWVRPWDNRGKCYINRERIQCWSNASQHVPIYLQPFSRNSSRKIQVRNFSTCFAHFGLPWVRPWDYCGKCHMDRKRIQWLSNASQHVPICLQPFLRYSDISVASDWLLTVFVSEWVFLPHFASPGCAPGTIAVKVARLERGFNACKTPPCI